ncbi:hypothetical protein IQ277_30655 [Nostocales cyanobacterium LEGE 12452]|nr:hypothetical protein [Nostocales cyanobacterium LEGE 12452]
MWEQWIDAGSGDDTITGQKRNDTINADDSNNTIFHFH